MTADGITYIEIEPEWTFSPQELMDIKRTLSIRASQLYDAAENAAEHDDRARAKRLSEEQERLEAILAKLLK